MDYIWEALIYGIPSGRELTHFAVRLLAASFFGALIGIQREKSGKPAGFRTHILVCLGTALFILACSSVGMTLDALSRVIQGIVTGIGFIGAGAILKLNNEQDVKGLTTAAGVWMTAAIGVAAGLGSLGVALLGTVITLVTLALLMPFEMRAEKSNKKQANNGQGTEQQD
ncbi:magnesium transporter MgtC [Oceanisphaera profunda]|uniref:Protein MgtC n=1 Tax=Oceanisphaera profunda TaxID=1416627 RepID=A0A1Y0D2I1_9GAMM|nr:MgtC/SapB family protein [Oceanisphaera profunda]ART81732.1 magnesium transporter MgtC [Oceanisphaera profunda]